MWFDQICIYRTHSRNITFEKQLPQANMSERQTVLRFIRTNYRTDIASNELYIPECSEYGSDHFVLARFLANFSKFGCTVQYTQCAFLPTMNSHSHTCCHGEHTHTHIHEKHTGHVLTVQPCAHIFCLRFEILFGIPVA